MVRQEWPGVRPRHADRPKRRRRRLVLEQIVLRRRRGSRFFHGRGSDEGTARGGGPMLFSGPLQPALLGAALASAELHLGPEFTSLQQGSFARIDRAHGLADKLGLTLASKDRSPILFVRCGPEQAALALAKAMQQRGFYVCVSVFCGPQSLRSPLHDVTPQCAGGHRSSDERPLRADEAIGHCPGASQLGGDVQRSPGSGPPSSLSPTNRRAITAKVNDAASRAHAFSGLPHGGQKWGYPLPATRCTAPRTSRTKRGGVSHNSAMTSA